jgi:hypothetical protein
MPGCASRTELTVNVSPRARCTIEVIYDTVVSKAKGLGPKTGGRITWRWRFGSVDSYLCSTSPDAYLTVMRE